MEYLSRYHASRQVTLLGAAKNITLAFFKILFGILGHSHALFADGIHSLSDLSIDTLVLFASKVGSQGADRDHQYGHGRVETAAIVFLAMMLAGAGVLIIWHSVEVIIGHSALIQPSFYVFFVALLSVVANEFLYIHTKRVGKKIKSNLLIANAFHHRSDSITSIVVLFGILFSYLGFPKFDPIAAILVGIMILHMAWKFGWSSIRELVDTGIEGELLETIKKTITDVPGVRALHQLRTRLVAGNIFLDVHILVDPKISVSEGHYISQHVHFDLRNKIPNIADVTCHIDPEDDEVSAPSFDLSDRTKIIAMLKDRWKDHKKFLVHFEEYLDKLVIHYLSGKVYIEVYLPLYYTDNELYDLKELQKTLQDSVKDIPEIASIKLFFF